ncbi:MAG TPA: hypothetical protein VFR70_01390 [Flavobacterium sp.]|nr:hypothetical protein [Flavobacterium sp.]
MKTYTSEDAAREDAFSAGNCPLNAASRSDNDDKEYGRDDEDEDGEDENADWGDVDPAGGEAPGIPGGAV